MNNPITTIQHMLNDKGATWAIMKSHLDRYTKEASMLVSKEILNTPKEYNMTAPILTDTLRSFGIVEINGVILKGTNCTPDELDTLGCCDLNNINAALELLGSNPDITDMLLLFNSPGGQDTGVQETANLVDTISKTKRVIAYSDNLFCSAAYYIGCHANYVYTSPSAKVGCIGVFSLVADESKALQDAGITINSFVGGKYKLLGADFKPMTDIEKAIVQADIDTSYEQFKNAVRSKRPNVQDETMQGLVYSGEDAITNGLSDGLIDTPDELLMLLNNN